MRIVTSRKCLLALAISGQLTTGERKCGHPGHFLASIRVFFSPSEHGGKQAQPRETDGFHRRPQSAWMQKQNAAFQMPASPAAAMASQLSRRRRWVGPRSAKVKKMPNAMAPARWKAA
jgi:hypothetical protein